jgi:aryl-alcohol dehydrogenase-like predicted oxidoreductase
MDYVKLGRSGLKVSRLCLGAMNFGTSNSAPTNESDAKTIIDKFLGDGYNFIDTANVYTQGQSEEIVGRAIKSKRDSVVLATKGRGQQGPGPNDIGLSRVHLTRALDASLKRLGTDYVDLYQMHRWDDDTPIEETMEALTGFVKSGKVRYIGASNFTGSQIVEAQWAAARQNGIPFISLQPRYSLIARDIEADVLPAAERHGMGTLIYSPLGGGVLTGKYKKGEEPSADTRIGRRARTGQGNNPYANSLTDQNYAIVAEVEKIAKEVKATPAAVSIAWALTRRGVTSVIAGPRTMEQMEDYFAGMALTLPDTVVQRLSDVSRPTGAAGNGRLRETGPARA